MPLTRKLGWEQILERAVQDARDRTFEWGKFDCCMWACDVVLAITGLDVAALFRGQYNSRNSMAKMLKRKGAFSLSSLCGTVARAHRMPEIPPLSARRGDLVLVKESGRHSLGVCTGVYVRATAAKGLAYMEQDTWVKAWRV